MSDRRADYENARVEFLQAVEKSRATANLLKSFAKSIDPEQWPKESIASLPTDIEIFRREAEAVQITHEAAGYRWRELLRFWGEMADIEKDGLIPPEKYHREYTKGR